MCKKSSDLSIIQLARELYTIIASIVDSKQEEEKKELII